MDVMMPDMDGIETCRRLKTNSNWQPIPVIMVTALDSKEDLARSLESGVDDFLTKPVNGLELRARVRSMLRIKQQYDALQATLNLRRDLSKLVVEKICASPCLRFCWEAIYCYRAIWSRTIGSERRWFTRLGWKWTPSLTAW